jgi:hypothetical protein
MLCVESTISVTLIQAAWFPIEVTYTAEADREVTYGGHVDEYVGTAHVSVVGAGSDVFPCRFRIKRVLFDTYLAESLVDASIRGHLAENQLFRAWLRRQMKG